MQRPQIAPTEHLGLVVWMDDDVDLYVVNFEMWLSINQMSYP